jgi:hypothetical protein
MAKILDTWTGKTIEVPDNQLGQYGLNDQAPTQQAPAQTLPQATPTQQVPQDGEEAMPKYYTGHSLEEHRQALSAARQKGDKVAIKQITEDMAKEYQYQKDTGVIAKKTEETAKQKDLAAGKQDSLQKAKALLNIVQQKKKGELSSEDYESAVNSLASQYVASKAFAEGGKNLTGTELSILTGQIPVIEKHTGTPREKLVAWSQGREIPQTGKLVETPDEIERKMKIAIATLEGKPVDNKLLRSSGKKKMNLGENAGKDAAEIINGLLNLPAAAGRGIANTALDATSNDPTRVKSAVQSANPNHFLGQMGLNVLNEANEVTGRPLEGGDVLGRIMNRAQEKPVTTALDVLPFLPKAKALLPVRGGKAAGVAEEGVAASPKGVRHLTDLMRGGGSKDFIKQTVGKETAIPQNQVLLDEGILKHPTETGRIQATSASLNKHGSELGKVYEGSDKVYKGSELHDLIGQGLKEAGYDEKAIQFIRRYVGQQGDFDLASGDNIITMDRAWKAAQRLEKSPPKMMKNPESARAYKELSQDAARIIRKSLGDKVPETKPLNARYSALRDYYDTGLKDPQGVHAKGGINTVVEGGKNIVVNPALNFIHSVMQGGR